MPTAPLIVFIVIGLAVCFLFGRFNFRTFSFVRGIQDIARRQGSTWDFYGNVERMSAFVLKPEKLLEPLDSDAAKQRLLDHRKTMWRTIFTGWAIMLLGFVCAIAVPIGTALLSH
jgi:Na+-transporting NADH:ubiquinone oxidoreductase subunit NqrB